MSFVFVLVILHELWLFSNIYICLRNFLNATSIVKGRVLKISQA